MTQKEVADLLGISQSYISPAGEAHYEAAAAGDGKSRRRSLWPARGGSAMLPSPEAIDR